MRGVLLENKLPLDPKKRSEAAHERHYFFHPWRGCLLIAIQKDFEH